MALVMRPATREEIAAIRQRRKHKGVYGGLTERLRELAIGEGVWVEAPEGVPINKHQTHVAATARSLYAHRGLQFMTRRDAENNRVAVIRME